MRVEHLLRVMFKEPWWTGPLPRLFLFEVLKMEVIPACPAYIIEATAWNQFDSAIVSQWPRAVILDEDEAEALAAHLTEQAEAILKAHRGLKRVKAYVAFDPLINFRGEVWRITYRVTDFAIPLMVHNYTLASLLKVAA